MAAMVLPFPWSARGLYRNAEKPTKTLGRGVGLLVGRKYTSFVQQGNVSNVSFPSSAYEIPTTMIVFCQNFWLCQHSNRCLHFVMHGLMDFCYYRTYVESCGFLMRVRWRRNIPPIPTRKRGGVSLSHRRPPAWWQYCHGVAIHGQSNR